MAIDMHSHYYGGLVAHLRRRASRPYVSVTAEGQSVLNAMTASTVMTAGYTDIPARIAYLDAAGIRTQLVTFPGALGLDAMAANEVAPIIADFNDHLGEVCRGSSGRLVGLAGLPMADIDMAARELRRVRRDVGLLGAILPGNFFLTIERAQSLRPLFAAGDDVGALFMIYPGLAPNEFPPAPMPDPSVYRASGLDLQASISHMGITLLFGEFVENYRNIAIQLVNLGGTLPFVLERLDAIAISRHPQQPFPRDGLRRMYYDCASLGPLALQLAIKVFGADHVMLGTDYPIFQPQSVLTTVDGLEITDVERELIVRGTAHSMISRFA